MPTELLTDHIIANVQVFFLIFARVFAMTQVAPVLSSEGIPLIARTGLSFLAAVTVFPWVLEAGYVIPQTGGAYVLLLIGEAMIGILVGFYIAVLYTAFQVSGQFFSLQLGFGASQVLDPLSQVEIPVMGQFLNLVAMFIFVSTLGFQRLFLTGVYGSFRALRAIDLVLQREDIVITVVTSLSRMFEYALMLAFPILGTMILIQVTMGLLAKSAPQMNLLMLGFPASILVAFSILVVAIPMLMSSFDRILDMSFEELIRVFTLMRGVEG